MPTKLRGTMLVPGVSANRRWYTPELIQKAHDRLAERLKDGNLPVTMLTHHDAEDNSTHIVGRVTGVSLDNGNLNYTAELADTTEAATIAALVNQPDGKQYLRGVSIRGWWVGDPVTKTVEGVNVTTADDMVIDGLDFTKTPGVTGAYVVPASSDASETVIPAPQMIHETASSLVVFTEALKTKPYGSVRYADPGYQSDKVKRYPIETEAHAKAAWSYVSESGNASQYTPAQQKRIRSRIKGALVKFGVDVTQEAAMPQPLTGAATTLSECFACDDGPRSGFSISAYNGPLTVSVSAYSGIEPEDLADVAMAAMQAACDAINVLDPDNDGDIDTGTASENTDDNQMETAPASAETEESAPVETTEETTTPTEETTNESEATPAAAETLEEAADNSSPVTRAELVAAVQEAVSAALAPRESAEASSVEETAPVEEAAPTEAELREAIRLEVIAEALASGVITRKGLVEKANGPEPEKPLHEMNEEEWRAYQQDRSALFFSHDQ